MMKIFFFLSFSNILLILLIRFLIKRNIFIKKLAYILVVFQILITIVSLVRERNFENINYYLIFSILSFYLITVFLLPLVFNKLVSEQKKLNLVTLENSIKVSLVETYHEFIEKHSKISTICDFFSEKLTIIVRFLLFSNKIFFLVWIPWLIFVNFLLFETIVTQKFILTPYFLAYFFIFYRIIVLILFICKNTMASYYIWPLRKKLNCFFGLDLLVNMGILKTIVLNQKITEKKDKIKNWQVFNEFLLYFIEGKILSNIFYYDLSEVKKHIDAMNFSLVLSISLFFVAKDFLGISKLCYFIFLFFYSAFCLVFLQKLLATPESVETRAFKDLFVNLKDFHGHLKWILINEHDFAYQDTNENLKKPIREVLPITGRRFLIISTFFHLFSLWVCFFFSSFNNWLLVLDFLLSISYFEPFFFFI